MRTLPLFLLTAVLSIMAATAQPFNKEINSEGKAPSLLGKISNEGLSSNSYSEWFTNNFDEYTPKQTTIETLKKELDTYTITAFMGTWCGDSKREVPRFYKVLEAANFPLDRLTMVAVSRDRESYKQSPGGEEEGLNIHRVPTFIVYKNGEEVNRIVESPVFSLEEDLVQILQNNYTSNYHGVTLVDDLLNEMDDRAFKKKHKRLIPKLKTEVKNLYELNTYSYVLFHSERKEEAIVVARLNTLLFPEEANTYSSLANKLKQTGKRTEALENYEKALALDPENKQAKSGIATLESEKVN